MIFEHSFMIDSSLFFNEATIDCFDFLGFCQQDVFDGTTIHSSLLSTGNDNRWF